MPHPINPEPCDGGYGVSFPDIPDALTQGDTCEEALEIGLPVLVTSFNFYFEDWQVKNGEAGSVQIRLPCGRPAR